METQKTPLSIKVIYWITNITFWFYAVVAAAAICLSILFLFNFFDDAQLHVGVPTAVNVLEQGKIELNNTSIDVEFKEMYGKIHFIDTPAFVKRIYGVLIFVVTCLMFYIFLIFKKFITNVYEGVYFELNNILLLKKISYALLGMWGVVVAYSYFQHFYIANNVNFNTVEVTGNVETHPEVLLIALFIWVLSHVFMKGCQLQEENNYTI